MTEEQKIPEDVFKEVEKTVLDILQEAAPVLSYWVFNHPKANNYCRVCFTADGGGDFDIIVQKPTKRRASCPLCHGSIDADSTPVEGNSSHALARQLLALPDKPVLIVKSEGQGTIDYAPLGGPWEDAMGSIRIQIEPEVLAAEGR